jgi:hypothetical protein
MELHTLRALFPLLVCLSACGRDMKRGPDTSTAPAVPSAQRPVVVAALPVTPTPDWKVYRGGGFTLRYPAEASLVPSSSHPEGLPGMAIQGPDVTVRQPGPEGGERTGPAYSLLISEFPNLGGRSPAEWVDSVRRARNAGEQDADDVDFLGPPDTVAVGTGPALRLYPFCGDCEPEEVYVVGPRRTVVFSILYDISIPGDRAAQGRLYDAILSTIRWAAPDS